MIYIYQYESELQAQEQIDLNLKNEMSRLTSGFTYILNYEPCLTSLNDIFINRARTRTTKINQSTGIREVCY